MNEFNVGETIYVDAQNGEMVFTTEMPEDGGAIAVADDGEGNLPPSEDEAVSLDKLMSE